ncbi:MAG: sulfotransferase family protein, partial [Gaiellaceae bacterium]
RAAWAWRRYASAVLAAGSDRVLEVRYERLSADPDGVADELAAFLQTPQAPLAASLRAAHGTSVGRWRRELTEEQLADVLAESAELLTKLGYLQNG